ncbi:hypothetical protein GXM_01029 [Nostoc sphaeroides CCNUC1]|uniref:Uncharacterized protein n=1 Tax=Nostoc sphaeroides CCNUC1 TaxID=2653204 RepID=A0A5P8VTU8_9NOSO|nr:hypothetical protein GXM_01029 [Nostoc sphaeroides CCNUC1]
MRSPENRLRLYNRRSPLSIRCSSSNIWRSPSHIESKPF